MCIRDRLDTIKQAVAEVMEDLQAGQMAGFEAVVAVLREILSAVYGLSLIHISCNGLRSGWC